MRISKCRFGNRSGRIQRRVNGGSSFVRRVRDTPKMPVGQTPPTNPKVKAERKATKLASTLAAGGNFATVGMLYPRGGRLLKHGRNLVMAQAPEPARMPSDGDGIVTGDVLVVRHASRNTIQCPKRTCVGQSNQN